MVTHDFVSGFIDDSSDSYVKTKCIAQLYRLWTMYKLIGSSDWYIDMIAKRDIKE